MGKKDPKSPATTSFAHDIMMPRWVKIATLLEGTEAMRDAGQTFLPQHPEESDRAYEERKSVTTLLNMTDMTLNSLVGRPFSAPIKVGEDVPKTTVDILDDVDLKGTSLDRFCRSWFRDGLAMGMSGVLVEYPRIEEKEGRARTLADDQQENLRPYLIHIKAADVIFASVEIIDGQEQFTHLRIVENVVERVGFAEVVKERIRVLEKDDNGVHGTVYEKKEDARRKVTWVVIETYDIDLDFIPFVMFYSAEPDGVMICKPPLMDLADLNIRHYQSTSDQIGVLTVARFPMLAVSGSIDSETLVIGPSRVLSVSDSQGRFYYVEHSGKAIASGRTDLLDLEELMAEYGATFLKKRPGGATATARALDSAEVTSALQDMALGFQDSLNLVAWYIALWNGEDEGGKFTVKTDFNLSSKAEQSLDTLQKSRVNRDLSRTQYLKSLIRLGLLSEEFPLEQNDAELEKESADLIDQEASMAEAVAKAVPEPTPAPPKA